jgi:D-glycero-D-manno-heptose 1,7-bisphosphate phosphatase
MPTDRRRSGVVVRGAVFLDRDGTVIEDRHYLKSPEDVVLVPNAANAVRRVNQLHRPVVVVTNQSGIARGLLTEADYNVVRARLDDLLSERGAFIDASYHCPHHPDFTGACDCRKPDVGLFRRAINDLNLDAAKSVYIGDRWRDIAVAQVLGGRGILVPSPDTPPADIARAAAEAEVVATLTEAVERAVALRDSDGGATLPS